VAHVLGWVQGVGKVVGVGMETIKSGANQGKKAFLQRPSTETNYFA